MDKKERIRRITQSDLFPQEFANRYIEQLEDELKEDLMLEGEVVKKQLENAMVEVQILKMMLSNIRSLE